MAEYIDGLITYLVQLFYQVLNAAFYPVYSLYKIIEGLIVYIWSTFADMVNTLILVFNTFYDFVNGILSLSFASVWVAILLIGLLMVIAMRVYYFLRDIEIFGFKI